MSASQPPVYGSMREIFKAALEISTMYPEKTIPLPAGYTMLHAAAMLHAHDEAQKIIDTNQCDINHSNNTKGLTPLLIACNENDTKMVRLLLSAGVRPEITSKKGMTPLIKAIQKKIL